MTSKTLTAEELASMRDDSKGNWMRSSTHYEGCYMVHWPCALLALFDHIDQQAATLDAIRKAWPFEDDPPDDVADAVKREMDDYQWLIHSVSLVYDSATNGLLSKPNTKTEAVIAVINDRIDKEIDDAVKEATEDLQAQLDAALAALLRGWVHVVGIEGSREWLCSGCKATAPITEPTAKPSDLGHKPDCILASREEGTSG